jgi:hypothetical protein
MATIEERKTNDLACDEIIKLCANGNADAESYLTSIGMVSRVLDDLIDKDYQVEDKQICRAFFELLGGLWLNPFFIKNAQTLIPLHIASYNAFMDSNEWAENGDSLKRLYSHVMKDYINELMGVTAFLCGGYSHMRQCSILVKETFIEEAQ